MKSSQIASFRNAGYNIFSSKLAPAGGKGSPLVEFISYMSKQYGDNPILGEEFLRAVVESKWPKTTVHLFVKVALTVTNCACMKLVDGVAKLTTKTNILAPKGKKFEQALNDIESSLSFLGASLNEESATDQLEKFKLFGKYCVRYSLLITNKPKSKAETPRSIAWKRSRQCWAMT